MRIVKPMKEIAAEVEVASAFPDQSQGSARSVPSICYHLINTPTPPIFIFKTLQIISKTPCKTEIWRMACVPRLTNQSDWAPSFVTYGTAPPAATPLGYFGQIKELLRSLLHSCLAAGKNQCPFTLAAAAPWEFG